MKINAHNRLRACPPGPQVLDIPQFRYVQDAQRYLNSLSASVKELSGHIQASQKKIGNTIIAGTVPQFSKLDSQYELLHDLYASWRALESTDAQFRMQFDARSGAAYTGVEAGLRELRAEVGAQMTKIFNFVGAAASLHCPTKFKNQVHTLTMELGKIPGATVRKTMMYASASAVGDPVYTAYTYMVGSSESDHMYVSAQWSPANHRMTYVQTNHEFATPDELTNVGPGTGARTTAEVVSAALSLLTDEGLDVTASKATVAAYVPDAGAHSSLTQALSYL